MNDMTPPYVLAPGDLLTTPAIAALLSCHKRTALRLIEAGYLPALRLGAGRSSYRVHAADLVAFIQQHVRFDPATVATSAPGSLPAAMPRPVYLVTHRSADGLTLVEPHRPPAGLEN
jgi:excisionase family DNA binding protein